MTPRPDHPALAVRDVYRHYGAGERLARALDGVDLSVDHGRFVAVMGPSGSGKSTLLACVAGLDRPSAGTVVVGGQDAGTRSETEAARFRRTHLGMVFQDFQLVPYLDVEQNVALPVRLAGRRVDRALVRDLLDRVGLADRRRSLPGELSGGQQQRVAIARALVTRPALVLADEPTGALDLSNARAVLALLRRCVDETAQTVVMVTHDPRAASYADEVVFLVDGRVAGTMHGPTVDAVAGQMAHLDDLVLAGAAS